VKIVFAHDYLTQRGGAERVVLSMTRAFPEAPLYTALYDPAGTFPEFESVDVRTLPLNRVRAFRRDHRLALPLLAPAFGRLSVDTDVLLCSSSGWAHGARTSGRKIVYCYTPARWLYQSERYLRELASPIRVSFSVLRPFLARWDRRAAASADAYLAISTAVQQRISEAYGRPSRLLPAPHSVDPEAPKKAVQGVEPGFFLVVSRLLPYKNVDVIAKAFRSLSEERLVVVGRGPDEARLRGLAGTNSSFLGAVSDAELAWLYDNAAGLLAASYEDYGLTPLEAAAFGKPSVTLEWGGFQDTISDGSTGLFFERPEPAEILGAIERFRRTAWDAKQIRAHAAKFSEETFIARLREIVAEDD
jgi:glycosyltransferase involved in cell wall biosynthesis